MLVRPKASIAMPDIRELKASAGSRIWIGGFESTHTLSVEVGGGSSLVGHMEVGDVTLVVLGASRIFGDVRAVGDVEFEISGESRVEMEGSARSATGNPVRGNINTVGASNVRRG